MVLVEAGYYAQIGATLRAVVLRLAAQYPAAFVNGVPAEIATERRAGADGGGVAGSVRMRRVGLRVGGGRRGGAG